MKRIGIALVLVLGIVFAGCSDDDVKKEADKGKVQLDGGGDSTTTQPEAGTDSSVTGLEGGTGTDGGKLTCKKENIGKACGKDTSEKDCGKNATCLLLTEKAGICTCQCTPDDSKTPLVNEDTCPGQPNIMCSGKSLEVTTGGKKSKKNFCLKLCTPKLGANSCNKPFVCHPSSGAFWYLYGKAVCFYSTADRGCAKDDDCLVSTGKKCSVAKKDCATGQKCLSWSTGGDAGLCIGAGKCDKPSGLCKPQTNTKTTKIGDPCKGDMDCGSGQTCMMEYDDAKDLGKVAAGKACKADSDCCSNSCTTGKCDAGAPCVLNNRNGYCTRADCAFEKTLTHAKCPTGSHCNKLYNTGFCQKSCKLASKTGADACRGNAKDKMGDYECRSWNALASSAGAFAKGPVCDFGPVIGCYWLKPPAGSTSTLSCASLGTYSGTTNDNKTKMGCRDLKNKVLSDKYSKSGWCFDDTASGAVAGTTTCTSPKVDCSGKCVDLQTDAANCGKCATACATATPKCVAGVCTK